MATEIINIQIREDGSRVVTRNIEGIGGAADKARGPLDRLKGLIATVVTGAAIVSLGRLADEYTNLQNRLRLVTTGAENLRRVNKELLTISNQTRSDLSATSELYFRLASNTKELGLSQQQLLGFTKSVNQAIILSGASSAEASGGLRQLAQGIASNTLRGEELNSVLENLPKVAEIIRSGLGVTIGEMRKLGAEGKISAKDIIDAFQKAGKSLDEEFGTTVPTLSQSFTVLKNNFLVFIGQLNESTGITATLSKLIIGLANNLDTIVPILAAIAVGIAAAFAPGVIASFVAQIKVLWALILANPFTAFAAIVATAVTALYAFRDEIKLGIDETTTLGDLSRAVWEDIKAVVSGVIDFISSLFKTATADWSDQTKSSTEKQESAWLTVPRTVLNVFDAIGAVVRGAMMGVAAVVMKVIDNIKHNFMTLGEAVAAAMSGDFATMSAKLVSNKSAFADVGKAWGDAMSESMQMQVDGGFVAWFDDKVKRAQQIGQERLKQAAAEGGLNPGGTPRPKTGEVDKGAAKRAARELERLKDALRGIKDAVDPVGAAERELAEVHDTLTRSVKAGLITQKESAALYEGYKETLKEQLDPLAALNREMDNHIDLLKMSSEQAGVEGQLRQMIQDLQRSGVKLTKEETDQLRAKLVVEQELERIARARDSIEQGSSKTKSRDSSEMLTALEQLKDLTTGDKFNVLNSLLGGSLDETQAAFDAQLEQFANYYAIIEQFRQQDLANEEIASQAKRAIKQQEMDMYLQRTSDALGAAAGLMKSNSKEAFRIGQAAAIGQAIVNTYTAATAAYQSAAAIPYVGWLLGPVAAAGAIAAGMAQVSAIRSQQMPAYRTGGSYTIGGSGGTDSQVVSMRGTPGETIHINTPHQANAMDRIAKSLEQNGGAGRGDVNIGGITVVQQGRADNKTPEQNARKMRREASKFIGV